MIHLVEGLHGLLIVVIVIVLGVAVAAFVVVFLHGWWVRLERIRYQQVEDDLRGQLMRLLRSTQVDDAFVKRLKGHRVEDRERLLSQMGQRVTGQQKETITELARRCGVLEHAKGLTRKRAWWRRLHGVRVFIAVGAGTNVVPSLLADPHPMVRSEAAAWCGLDPDPENIRRLLNLMDTPTLVDRFAVIDALVSLGPNAVQPLADRLPSCGPEGRKAGLTAALGLADPAFLPVALGLVNDPDPEVRTRAARLLSVLGDESAMQALQGLLEDPVVPVRCAAARGLGRLGAWRAAPSLEALLHDPHPDPRRDAALALGELGAPGWVLLRDNARTDSPVGRLANAVLETLRTPGDPETWVVRGTPL